ncbi:hypothetical protein HLK59_26575 [Streptomyces sp. S3(2020)]|uniref:hypothetical protein n=1 Tax=Streptomyces sp. S3(2020) TaxID=2732044 RepID=UPI0014886D0B|nr:hypothetical protein [Streptomyces sp. S3(2020)]NNN33866.1 hypothetical protein [Streptomyces sp. S3(2020)]
MSGRRSGQHVVRLLLSMAMAASTVVAIPVGQAAAVPSGVYAYALPRYNSDDGSVIDTATDTVTATIPVGATVPRCFRPPPHARRRLTIDAVHGVGLGPWASRLVAWHRPSAAVQADGPQVHTLR